MTMFPRVLVDAATPGADHLAETLSHRGYRSVAPLAQADVVIAGPRSVLDHDVLARVRGGVGLVVLLDRPAQDALPGIQSVLSAGGLAGSCGTGTEEAASRDGASAPARVTASEIVGIDLAARVDLDRLTPAVTFRAQSPAASILSITSGSDQDASIGAVSEYGDGTLVVLGIAASAERPSDDQSATELLFNAVTHAAARPGTGRRVNRSDVVSDPSWLRLKTAVTALQAIQAADGSIPNDAGRALAAETLATIVGSIEELAPRFPYDADYLACLVKDFTRWADGGFAVPDFLDSLNAFHPESQRVDGREHLVVFPMYTQNGSPDRHVEAILVQVIWPQVVADLEAGDYSNKLFVPIRFLDFTAGYDTNSAVLFPETIAMREVPKFTWGAIFADREAARFRTVIGAAAETTRLAMPADAARLLTDQDLTEQTFVIWDLIHDRTHMHGDLPFDPFMIKQRMPYFLYSLEELRCDLTAFRESVALEQRGLPHARLVQYAILFDRIFRFAITGSRVRNYDGLGGQLLFAWLHQRHVLHWTDNRLSIEWDRVAAAVLELSDEIDALYWRSIDRPKVSHWLAAYRLISGTLEPHPASTWAKGPDALPVSGPPKGLTDAVLPDEFPLSMFYEALSRKLGSVVSSTAGITG